MSRPVNRYRATFDDRCSGAAESVILEAKSDRGAARIASGYEVDNDGFFMCRLVRLSRWVGGGWRPVEQGLVSDVTHWMEVTHAS